MSRFIITGAAGFIGANLTKYISSLGHEVVAVVRPDSVHNDRIGNLEGVKVLSLCMEDMSNLCTFVDKADFFIHLIWNGARDDKVASKASADYTVEAVEQAVKMGCYRIVITGSQAEYGATKLIQTEDLNPRPFDEYGKAKVGACLKSRCRARELGIEWVWGRIFSLIGKYEPEERLFPHMIKTLCEEEPLTLSSCRQNWDYLDVKDAVRALEALALCGKDGEIYNVANGNFRPLKESVLETKEILSSKSELLFGDDAEPFVSLQPSVEKIRKDTGWKAEVSYIESVKEASRQWKERLFEID